ncbi:MAG: nitrous oxide reductase accessory protein NosL [Myxococcales bacterium]
MSIRRRVARTACLLAALWSSAALAAAPAPASLPPDAEGHFRIIDGDRCPVCRMFPARNPKLAAAIELSDGRAFYPCGPGCLLEALEHPETHLGVGRGELRRVLVQEYLGGKPVDAAGAFFVEGSDVSGPMGPAPIPLASEADAATFRATHGGKPPVQLAKRGEPQASARGAPPALGSDEVRNAAEPQASARGAPTALGSDEVRNTAEPQASARGAPTALGSDEVRNTAEPILNPLPLVLALQFVGLLLLAFVASGAIRHLTTSAGSGGSIRAHRAATLFLVLGAAAFVAVIGSASKSLVPGAMCGTGALQAMANEGGKTLALQAVALLVLAASWTIDSLRRQHPDSPLAGAAARLTLLSLAVQGSAALGLFKAVRALDPNRPVDCCSLVYGRATQVASSRLDGSALLALAAGLAALALMLAVATLWRPQSMAGLALGFVSLAALPFCGLALLRVVSAHWRLPLVNECPWCLFLPEHGFLGYPLLAALAVVGWEAASAITARLAGGGNPSAVARVRSAAWRIGLALLVFAGLGSGAFR